MKTFDIAILGSGASGCMCAIQLADTDKKILMIDKNKTTAKKLMATGNGRCNLSNTTKKQSINFYNQNIDNFLSIFDVKATLKLFNELGLETYSDDEGRIYPLSNSAKSVIEIINNKLEKTDNISIFNQKTIEKVEKFDEKFKIITNDETFIVDKIVFALGGNNNNILENLNVKCKDVTPSLCSLKTKEKMKVLANTRISPVSITAISANGKTYSETGEVLFKEQGLSGICIFNASSLFAREDNFYGIVTIDLLPKLSEKEVVCLLEKRKDIDCKIRNFFDGLFVRELGYYLLEKCKIDESRTSTMLKKEEISLLAKTIKSLAFTITAPLENNQVYSGGALLNDLTENLESKSCPGLYICGEACDVDGICGGFNLQWAWTSGYIVGNALK